MHIAMRLGSVAVLLCGLDPSKSLCKEIRKTMMLCPSGPDGNGIYLCSVDQAMNPSALCNDSSPPVFWVRRGSGTGLATWFLWLEGGGQCTDAASCAQRVTNSPLLLTSTGFKPKPGAGILSSSIMVNPKLYNANLVFFHYCSSDLWTGSHTPTAPYSYKSGDTSTWVFQGRANVLATIATLKELPFNFSGAKKVLLGGSSAGGVGITLEANDILQKLPPTVSQVGLVNDAGFTLDIGQFDSTAPSPYIYAGPQDAFQTTILNGISLWAGTGDKKCEMQFPMGSGGHVECYNTAKVLQKQQVSIPTFVDESQMDAAQLRDELCPQTYGNPCPLYDKPTPEAMTYESAFAEDMATTLTAMGTQAQYSVYSPDAPIHTMLDDSLFTTSFSFPGGQFAPRDAFDAWIVNPQARVVNIGN